MTITKRSRARWGRVVRDTNYYVYNKLQDILYSTVNIANIL